MGNECSSKEHRRVETDSLSYLTEPLIALLPCYSFSIIDTMTDFENHSGKCLLEDFIPLNDISNPSSPFTLYRAQNKLSAKIFFIHVTAFNPFENEKSELLSFPSFYSQRKFYNFLAEKNIQPSSLSLISYENFITDSFSTTFGIHTINYIKIYEHCNTSYEEILEYRASLQKLGEYNQKELKFVTLQFANWLLKIHELGYSALNIFPENFFIEGNHLKIMGMEFLAIPEDGKVKAKFCPQEIIDFLPELKVELAYFEPIKADIYMLGILFLAILCRESDFDALSDPSYRNSQMKGLRDTNPEFTLILEKLLESNPEDRPSLETIIKEIDEIRVSKEKAHPIKDFSFEKCTNSHWKEGIKLANPISKKHFTAKTLNFENESLFHIVNPTLNSGLTASLHFHSHEVDLSFPEKLSKIMFFLKVGNPKAANKLLLDIGKFLSPIPYVGCKDIIRIVLDILTYLKDEPSSQSAVNTILNSLIEKIKSSLNTSANTDNRADFLFCKVIEADLLARKKDFVAALEILDSAKGILEVINVTNDEEKKIVSYLYCGLFVCQTALCLTQQIFPSLLSWENKMKNVLNIYITSLINRRKAKFYIANGEVSHGRSIFKESLNECCIYFGDSHVSTLRVRLEYGLALMQEGLINEGDIVITSAATTLLPFLNKESKIRASVDFAKGISSYRTGNILQAITEFESCLTFACTSSNSHPFVIPLKNNLSSLYLELHDNEKAKIYNSHAKELKDASIASCDVLIGVEKKWCAEQDEVYILILNNQVLIQFLQGNKEEAEQILAMAYSHAIELRKIQRSHQDYENAFFTLLMTSSLLNDFFGRKDTALRTLKICEDLREKNYSTKHPDMLQIKINTAKLLAEQRNYKKAYSIMNEVISNSKAEYTHFSSIPMGILKHNMACIQSQVGNTEQAELYFGEAEVIFSKFSIGNRNYYNALVNSNLAAFALMKSDRVLSQELLAKANLMMSMKEEYYINIFLKNNAAIVNYRFGYIPQALELLFQAYESAINYLGTQHPLVATIENNLGSCYVARDDFKKGNELFEKAFRKKECFHKLGDAHMLPCLFNYAISLTSLVEVSQFINYVTGMARKQYGEDKETEHGDLYSLISEIYINKKNEKDAIYFCKKSIEIYSKHSESKNKLEASKDCLKSLQR